MRETGGETACTSANSYELVSEMKSLGNNDQERSWSFCQACFMNFVFTSHVLFLDAFLPWFKHWTWKHLHVFLQLYSSCKTPQQPVPQKTCWLKWAGRCAASSAWIQSPSELNLSPFPLINEWLEEAESRVAEPIYWRTFGAVKSVRLITVNHPEVFALNRCDPEANSSEEI